MSGGADGVAPVERGSVRPLVTMNGLMLIAVVGVLAAAWWLRRLTGLRPDQARAWVSRGAKLIDVRSVAEFREQHLPGTINIPLEQLRHHIARHAPDKEQAVLLHCRSGGRSGMGAMLLKQMGYRKVFNLGSLSRARQVLGP